MAPIEIATIVSTTDAIHHSHNDRQRAPYFVVKILSARETAVLELKSVSSRFVGAM